MRGIPLYEDRNFAEDQNYKLSLLDYASIPMHKKNEKDNNVDTLYQYGKRFKEDLSFRENNHQECKFLLSLNKKGSFTVQRNADQIDKDYATRQLCCKLQLPQD